MSRAARQRRRGVAAMAIAAVIAAATTAGVEAAKQRPPERLLATADEWSLIVSRTEIRRGPAIVQLYNAGEDPHDMKLKRIGHPRAWRIGRTEPGEVGTIELRMRRGRWRLWCSIKGHRKKGMEARVRAKRRL